MVLLYIHSGNPSAISIISEGTLTLGHKFPVQDIYSSNSHEQMLMQIFMTKFTEILFTIKKWKKILNAHKQMEFSMAI